MKFKDERPLANVDAAVKKLLEIANGLEADHAGRLAIEIINRQFREAGASYDEYGTAVKAAVDRGYIDLHPSGGYVTFTQAGADLSTDGSAGPRFQMRLSAPWHRGTAKTVRYAVQGALLKP
jgi:hypothetical protein